MDDLVNRVSSQVGMSGDMAEQAVSIVVNYLKQKLPGPVAGQIDDVLAGQGSSQGMGEKIKDVFGGRE
ncbi:MAG: DUF2267 domain-containing protein [Chloroflexi bacterium]|jgi:hypothetical protein|nr:DUF2267 domain-containing protein [Chloroflexota bacterium]